jgi:hypothetical protein
MVEQGGTGGTVAAPATREIWDGIYGLEGKAAALKDGALPTTLPVILRDGRIRPPGTIVHTVPAPSVEPSSPADSSAPPAALPAAEPPSADLSGRRRGGVT